LLCPLHLKKHYYLYRTWVGMRSRCHNPRAVAYRDYGGRGIIVCDEWRDNAEAFVLYALDTLGARPPGHSLDRINNDDGYRPGNVRWATHSQQMRNRRPFARRRIQPFSDWLREIGYVTT